MYSYIHVFADIYILYIYIHMYMYVILYLRIYIYRHYLVHLFICSCVTEMCVALPVFHHWVFSALHAFSLPQDWPEGISSGSMGHPFLCKAPCIRAVHGTCMKGPRCEFCHLEHNHPKRKLRRQETRPADGMCCAIS